MPDRLRPALRAWVFTAKAAPCQKRGTKGRVREGQSPTNGVNALKADELRKLDAFFKKTFMSPALQVKARPRKDDSCELYIGEDFLGIIDRIEDEGEVSYNLAMAILDIDLE